MNYMPFASKNDCKLSVKTILFLLKTYAILSTANCYAQDSSLQLFFFSKESGWVKDGQTIGVGRLSCAGEHSYFEVWMPSNTTTSELHSYLIYDLDNRHSSIKVRLQGNGWQGVDSLNGLRKRGGEYTATFEIVASGEQQFLPGRYPLIMNGRCL